MYRFLFSSKWLGYFVLALIFATGCVLLGRWQMDRRAETLAEINRVVNNYSATPFPFRLPRHSSNPWTLNGNGRRWNSMGAMTFRANALSVTVPSMANPDTR